jgi:hypothetical protein
VIATDPKTITRVQGVRFSSPKTRVVTGGIRIVLDRRTSPSNGRYFSTAQTSWFEYILLDLYTKPLKYTTTSLISH